MQQCYNCNNLDSDFEIFCMNLTGFFAISQKLKLHLSQNCNDKCTQ